MVLSHDPLTGAIDGSRRNRRNKVEINLWHLRLKIKWEPLSLKRAAKEELKAGLVYAVKLVRKRRPEWSLKEAVDYCKVLKPAVGDKERGQ